ncbi:hypothetical protein [Caldithrix abyssi]
MKMYSSVKIVFIHFLIMRSLLASFEPGRLPPYYLALGGSGIAGQSGIFFNINPALLALDSKTELCLQYRNFYNISQLNEFGLSFRGRIKGLPFGLFVSQFGDQNYREQQFSLHISGRFFEKFSFGLAIQNYFLQIKKYGNYNAVGLTLGIHVKVLPWLNVASVAGNINEPALSAKKGDIPIYFINGISLKPLPKAQITLDLFKDERFDFDYRIGLTYALNSMFSLMVGFRQQAQTFASGLIFKRKVVSICYALEYHARLGVSNAISVGYFL